MKLAGQKSPAKEKKKKVKDKVEESSLPETKEVLSSDTGSSPEDTEVTTATPETPSYEEPLESPSPAEAEEAPAVDDEEYFASAKNSKRKKGKAVGVVDDEEDAQADVQEDVPKTKFKDVLLSLIETTIAAAILAVVGYQLGGLYLGNLISGIIGG